MVECAKAFRSGSAEKERDPRCRRVQRFNGWWQLPSIVNTQPTISYGQVLDQFATDALRPEVKALSGLGLNLVYCYRPPNLLRRGRANIVALALEAHVKAVELRKPWLLVYSGDPAPLKFRFPRSIEVATVVAWPDSRVWARTGILESRTTSEQQAFVCSTGLKLPIADKRVSPVRRLQARELAIAVVAVSCGMPLPTYPGICDGRGRTTHDMARQIGVAGLLRNWR